MNIRKKHQHLCMTASKEIIPPDPFYKTAIWRWSELPPTTETTLQTSGEVSNYEQ